MFKEFFDIKYMFVKMLLGKQKLEYFKSLKLGQTCY